MLAVLAFMSIAAALAFGGVLLSGIARRAAQLPEAALIDRLDAMLPQTQCGQCTYAGCRPYAVAMAQGAADFNQCPPGGHETAARLATLLGRISKPVSTQYGNPDAPPTIAYIHEDLCIGCARCLPACPVDAIVGAARHTHTVIATDCTGCKLCIAPCPVDCIEMRTASSAVRYPAAQGLVTWQ